MTQTTTIETLASQKQSITKHLSLLRIFFAGILAALGFAPFHLPGLAILSLALLYAQLCRHTTVKSSFLTGFVYGLGFFTLGITWIYVSIYEYGHLNPLISGIITTLFVGYLACFPALATFTFVALKNGQRVILHGLLFSALWCLSEFARATTFGGFPWLLLGQGQIDTPFKFLLPLTGVYGVGFLTCFTATCLYHALSYKTIRLAWLVAFVAFLLAPLMLQNKQWSTLIRTPIRVGVIQANLSMRDKWDDSLFWEILNNYQEKIEALLGKKDLIVLPESAIPLPAHYISDVLSTLNEQAEQKHSAVLIGIPATASEDEGAYYNTLSGFGAAEGVYFKQQLVPFGEYIPDTFMRLIHWLSVPVSNLKPGKNDDPAILVNDNPIATLICYELAYPELIRKQLPRAKWIVSVSDDGWFGHSLAIYQHLQMAQVLSVLTGRYQILANNNGLSSIIDDRGNIIESLPTYKAGILEGDIFSAKGMTIWAKIGDKPALIICFGIFMLSLLGMFRTRTRRFVTPRDNLM